MRESDLRRILKQDIRGKYVLRPLHEYVVTRIPPKNAPEDDLWSFSWDGATLQYTQSKKPGAKE